MTLCCVTQCCGCHALLIAALPVVYQHSAGRQLKDAMQTSAIAGARMPNRVQEEHGHLAAGSVICQDHPGMEEVEATEQQSDQLTCIACGASIQLLLTAAASSSVDQVICLQVCSACSSCLHCAVCCADTQFNGTLQLQLWFRTRTTERMPSTSGLVRLVTKVGLTVWNKVHETQYTIHCKSNSGFALHA